AFHLGGAAGYADHDPRAGREKPVVMDTLDELLEHLLGDGEVGDYTVFHRPDGSDIAGRAAEHLLGGEPHFLDHFLAIRTAVLADCDDRRLVEDDSLAPDVDQRVGGAEIDGDIVGEVAVEKAEHRG